MAKAPKDEPTEVNPQRGDELLRCMLKAKPKTHDEMVRQRNRGRATTKKGKAK